MAATRYANHSKQPIRRRHLTGAKTAAHILSWSRLPPKKKLSASNSTGKKLSKKNQQLQQGAITRVDKEEQEARQSITSRPVKRVGGNHTRSNTISQKLHDLGKDIKEVAHGVGSSIISSAAALPSVFTPNNTSSAPSSPSKLSMTASLGRKPNRTKLKIAKTNAAQLQAQLESQLSPKIDLRKIKNKYLLWTCSALKLQIFEVILPSTLSH
ncbi:hypothetical protein PtA15_17A98 [Puccinia triticina]|uniref:Ribosome biogenesis protein SLX9 n=1 Tax=Puccinia triticina TaxID=208348 RepID=A0ABY7D4S3_9BASI|nr:uncharacterized protein PtA15_17A98 [Puccinia triticina]WAQ92616.1 hypothetical protein PtA15_17A98 [Puccinia triticina]